MTFTPEDGRKRPRRQVPLLWMTSSVRRAIEHVMASHYSAMHIFHGFHIFVIVGPGAANNFHAKVINPNLPRNGSAVGQPSVFSRSAMELWRGYDGAGVPHHGTSSENQRVRRERRTLGFIVRGFNHCLGYHIACTHHIVSGTVSKTVSKLWKLFGNFWGEKRSKSKLHVDPLRPRPRLRMKGHRSPCGATIPRRRRRRRRWLARPRSARPARARASAPRPPRGQPPAGFGPAAGPNPEGYDQPGLPPPLAIPGAANPLELYGGGLANSTGTQPPTGVPFGAHPLKQTPEILGSTTRPASAMAQIDPAPPAELVDLVSASPLEPFANPD
jgi:hypothetical protein